MNGLMETICLICNNVRIKSIKGVCFHKLLSLIRKEFKLYGIDLELRSHRRTSLDPAEYYVNAYYDSINDQNYDVAIEVIIYHNFDKTVDWDRYHVTDLLIQIFDAVIHEHKHRKQSIKRNYKTYWATSSVVEEYLSDPDEIDAYALSIAVELCRSLGKYRSLKYMSKLSALSRLKIKDRYVSPNLYGYLKVFHSIEDPVLMNLSKKIYKRLLKIDPDTIDRKSTRLNSSHIPLSRMPSSA